MRILLTAAGRTRRPATSDPAGVSAAGQAKFVPLGGLSDADVALTIARAPIAVGA